MNLHARQSHTLIKICFKGVIRWFKEPNAVGTMDSGRSDCFPIWICLLFCMFVSHISALSLSFGLRWNFYCTIGGFFLYYN